MWIELSPHDAGQLGIAEGDTVRVESPRGRIQAPARISGTRPGVVFAPFRYGYFDGPSGHGPGSGPGTAANELTRTEWDPVPKQPVYTVTAVKVTKGASAPREEASP